MHFHYTRSRRRAVVLAYLCVHSSRALALHDVLRTRWIAIQYESSLYLPARTHCGYLGMKRIPDALTHLQSSPQVSERGEEAGQDERRERTGTRVGPVVPGDPAARSVRGSRETGLEAPIAPTVRE